MNPTRSSRPRRVAALLCTGIILCSGCAFDIVSVRQTPATFVPVPNAPENFSLSQDTEVLIGSGFPTRLHASSVWHLVGTIEQGQVFTTRDQIVTVEASNIHEAQLVVARDNIVGFFLPVEKTFAPAKQPVPIVRQSSRIK
jgi:hypothetical protein